MTEFTPLTSLIGGALIGISAVLLMAFNGRIAGISGMASRVLPPWDSKNEFGWRLSFLIGIMSAPLIFRMITGQAPDQSVSDNIPLMIAAGLLVGFGSVFGNGCTSGHGVCGMARLSRRSIVATATFMSAAFVTVFIVRHVMGG